VSVSGLSQQWHSSAAWCMPANVIAMQYAMGLAWQQSCHSEVFCSKIWAQTGGLGATVHCHASQLTVVMAGVISSVGAVVSKKGSLPLYEGPQVQLLCVLLHLFCNTADPSRYKTELCQYGSNCDRPVCFFGHSLIELRVSTAVSPACCTAAGVAVHACAGLLFYVGKTVLAVSDDCSGSLKWS